MFCCRSSTTSPSLKLSPPINTKISGIPGISNIKKSLSFKNISTGQKGTIQTASLHGKEFYELAVLVQCKKCKSFTSKSSLGTRSNVTLHSTSNWNKEMLVFTEGEKPECPEKNPWSKGENQQQTQPTYMYDAESGYRTRAILVGGECSPTVPSLLFLFWEMLPADTMYLTRYILSGG